MSESVLALPVSVEQVAAVINQMSEADQKRLLDLAPNLKGIAAEIPSRTVEQIRTSVAQLQAEVMATLNHQPLSARTPFLGDLTLGEYHALPDEEKARLWDEWADMDVMDLGEQEVRPDALPAGSG